MNVKSFRIFIRLTHKCGRGQRSLRRSMVKISNPRKPFQISLTVSAALSKWSRIFPMVLPSASPALSFNLFTLLLRAAVYAGLMIQLWSAPVSSGQLTDISDNGFGCVLVIAESYFFRVSGSTEAAHLHLCRPKCKTPCPGCADFSPRCKGPYYRPGAIRPKWYVNQTHPAWSACPFAPIAQPSVIRVKLEKQIPDIL